ncbi:MAG: glycosyltransferase family 4 protein [bacterium]
MESRKDSTATSLAFLTSVIPALSATFIYREVFELERCGYNLHIYSLRRPERGELSAESLPLCERTYYLLPAKLLDVLAAHAYFACLHPLRYARAAWKMLTPHHHRFKDRIRSLLHFGEGVVLARKMQRDGITHLHVSYISHPASIGRVVHLLIGIPYSISAHTYDIWHERLLLPEKINEARFIACCSDAARTELIKYGRPEHASKIHVVYHGIDTRRFLPPVKGERDPRLILTVGRLDPVKGFEDLINACAELNRQGVEFVCEIVGEGPQRGDLATLIDQVGVSEKVHLKGAVLQENILAYYQRAAVFVLPCLTVQGIPNVLVEAMATGLPAISTNVSGITELIQDGTDGFLVPPRNPHVLAKRLKQLLQDGSLRKTMGEAAHAKICACFDNRNSIKPQMELFERECGVKPISRATEC